MNYQLRIECVWKEFGGDTKLTVYTSAVLPFMPWRLMELVVFDFMPVVVVGVLAWNCVEGGFDCEAVSAVEFKDGDLGDMLANLDRAGVKYVIEGKL